DALSAMALLAADPGLCAAVGLGNCIDARKRSSQVGPNLLGLLQQTGGARPNEFGPTDTSTIGGRSKGPIAEITAHTVRRTERDRTVPCSNSSARAPAQLSSINQSSRQPPWLWPSCSASHGSSSRSSSSSPQGGLLMASPEPLRREASSAGWTSSSARNSFGAPLRDRSW